MPALAALWPLVRHLPDQPLHHLVFRPHRLREKFPLFLRDIQHDRAGLEDRDRLATTRWIMIHQYRHPVIGVHLEELRRELIPPADITGHDFVLRAQFLQQDCHLLAIGCRPVVNVVHGYARPRLGCVNQPGHHATGSGAGKSPRSSADRKKCLSCGENRDSVAGLLQPVTASRSAMALKKAPAAAKSAAKSPKAAAPAKAAAPQATVTLKHLAAAAVGKPRAAEEAGRCGARRYGRPGRQAPEEG